MAALYSANFIAPLFFPAGSKGRIVLGSGLAAAAIQMAIFAGLGFVRLLGMGHFVWFPLVAWLWTRLDAIAPAAPQGIARW